MSIPAINYYSPLSHQSVSQCQPIKNAQSFGAKKLFGSVNHLKDGQVEVHKMNLLGGYEDIKASENCIHLAQVSGGLGGQYYQVVETDYIGSDKLKSAFEDFKKINPADVTEADVNKMADAAKDSKYIAMTSKTKDEQKPLKFIETETGKEVSAAEVRDYCKNANIKNLPASLS